MLVIIMYFIVLLVNQLFAGITVDHKWPTCSMIYWCWGGNAYQYLGANFTQDEARSDLTP